MNCCYVDCCYNMVKGQMFGTGSSRLEDEVIIKEMAQEYKEIIEDKEHIQDEFDHMFSKNQIRELTDEQMAFAWFSGHDTDVDEMIDGLELYKAIHHAKSHKESHDHAVSEHSPPGVPTIGHDPSTDSLNLGSEDVGAIEFVDQLLTTYDMDDDGRLSFVEFFASYEEAKEKLKIM